MPMIQMGPERVRRRCPRRAAVGQGGLLVALALFAGLTGCGAPVAGAAETEAAEGALSVWAAAAREYHQREDGWPDTVTDLDAVLLRAPEPDKIDVRVLRVDPMDDGSLAMAFAADRAGDDRGRGPLLRGSVIVNPVGAEARPAAVIHWSSGNWVRGTSGRTTLQSCALGAYERPAPDPSPASEPPELETPR
jgi:hypothetical protein